MEISVRLKRGRMAKYLTQSYLSTVSKVYHLNPAIDPIFGF